MSKYKLCVYLIITDRGTEADYALVHDFNTATAAEKARKWFSSRSGCVAVVIDDDPNPEAQQ